MRVVGPGGEPGEFGALCSAGVAGRERDTGQRLRLGASSQVGRLACGDEEAEALGTRGLAKDATTPHPQHTHGGPSGMSALGYRPQAQGWRSWASCRPLCGAWSWSPPGGLVGLRLSWDLP